MIDNQIKIYGSRIVIISKKSPKIVRFILTLLLVMSFLIPFIAFYVAIDYKIGFQFGIVIAFLIFWGIGFYILRVILWNTYGKEVLTLNADKVRYIADYKFFKDGYQELDTKDLRVEIVLDSNLPESKGYLKIHNRNDSIETVLKSKKNDLDILKHEINKWYNNI
ncbi:hypothetical protein [Marivirga arenosa]|uniref:Uncharacterized protein n=1 Tax=Marivirga arenosa TaxID=3059076 RepID=A0AA49JD22_9BACT|nr:hypothetical protein [Marivirga sp. BKB1-2]WKK81536.2 hypothetical protein QYS47_04385 [Marivirga sp. BKB1-2]